MDVAITGSTGHIGAGLVRAVLAQGRSARVLVRKDLRSIEGINVETTDGDILDMDSLMKLFKGVATVFHAAAKISIVGSEGGTVEKINIEGTRNVIEACLRSRVKRLIHFSSIHAHRSDPDNEVIDETRPLALGKGEFVYDRTKALSQYEVLRSADRGLCAVVLNPSAVVGPYDFKPSRMGEALLDIYHYRYPVLIDGGYNWVDVRDVVSCALAAEIKGRPGESYLVSGNWYHVCDIARIISELYDRKTPRFATPIWLCSLPSYFVMALARMRDVSPKFTPMALKALQSHRYISHDKASREFGYQPRPIEETIKDTLEWFRGQGMLDDDGR